MTHISARHTALKTGCYRLVSWVSTTALAWIFLGSAVASGNIDAADMARSTFIFSVVDMIANTVIYFVFERVWWVFYMRILQQQYIEKRS